MSESECNPFMDCKMKVAAHEGAALLVLKLQQRIPGFSLNHKAKRKIDEKEQPKTESRKT